MSANLPRVDFYILKNQSYAAIYPVAYRIIDKAYQQGHRVYVHLDGEANLNRFDELLWTTNDIGFIPHLNAKHPQANSVAVTLGYEEIPALAEDILLNLSPLMISQFQQFKRIIEIVPEEEPMRSAARQRYLEYKKLGLVLQNHTLS